MFFFISFQFQFQFHFSFTDHAQNVRAWHQLYASFLRLKRMPLYHTWVVVFLRHSIANTQNHEKHEHIEHIMGYIMSDTGSWWLF